MSAIAKVISFYRLQAQMLWTWRGGWGDLLKRGAVSVVIAGISLILTIAILPGITITRPISIVAAIIVIGILNALVRPIVLGLVAPISIVLVGIVTILFQVGMIWILGPLVPGIQVDSFLAAFIGSFVFATFHVILSSIVSLDAEHSYYGTLVRQLVARQSDVIRTDVPGVVIIQIDGLSHPVMRNQIRAGRAPVMSRWLRSDGYRLSRWEAMLPSQTSASQAGILHGNNDGIPAFRW
ncbi:MAG: phage holin family protein, partial [Candidatus Limnocylindrales bacterium]